MTWTDFALGFTEDCLAAAESMDGTSIVSAWSWRAFANHGLQIEADTRTVSAQKLGYEPAEGRCMSLQVL